MRFSAAGLLRRRLIPGRGHVVHAVVTSRIGRLRLVAVLMLMGVGFAVCHSLDDLFALGLGQGIEFGHDLFAPGCLLRIVHGSDPLHLVLAVGLLVGLRHALRGLMHVHLVRGAQLGRGQQGHKLGGVMTAFARA